MDWLSVVDGSHLPQIWHGLLAQVPTPSPNAVTQVDVFRQQVEFLAKANELLTKANERQSAEFLEKMKLLADENQKLSESFKTFITAFSVLSGGAVAALAVLFGKTLKEAQDSVDGTLNRKVETALAGRMEEVSEKFEVKLSNLKRSLEREVVVDKARVEYWLLGVQTPPKEFGLLERRGFQQVRFCDRDGQQSRRRDVDVVVLDLNNWCDAQGRAFGDLPQADRELKVKEQLDLITSGVAGRSMVFVVYVAGRYDYLDEVGKTYLVTPTNNPVTLVGTVVDAAYLAAGQT
jgi:hypothetical protein